MELLCATAMAIATASATATTSTATSATGIASATKYLRLATICRLKRESEILLAILACCLDFAQKRLSLLSVCGQSVSQTAMFFRYLPLVSEPIGKAVDTYTITQEVAGQIAKSNWIEKLTCKQKKYVKRSIKRINLLCMRQINVSRH